jgi:DUF971 family protein
MFRATKENEVVLRADLEEIVVTWGLGTRSLPRRLLLIYYPSAECLAQGIQVNAIVRLQETGSPSYPDIHVLL